jgi:hypothetical protein
MRFELIPRGFEVQSDYLIRHAHVGYGLLRVAHDRSYPFNFFCSLELHVTSYCSRKVAMLFSLNEPYPKATVIYNLRCKPASIETAGHFNGLLSVPSTRLGLAPSG